MSTGRPVARHSSALAVSLPRAASMDARFSAGSAMLASRPPSHPMSPAKASSGRSATYRASVTTDPPGSTPARFMAMFTSTTTRIGAPARRPASASASMCTTESTATIGSARLSELREAGHLLAADDLVRDQDVRDAGGRHDLGLAELGAGDPPGPRVEELPREGRDLDPLRVRAPPDARLGHDDPPHRLDVPLELREVHQQSRRVELLDPPAHELPAHRFPPVSAAATSARWRSCRG